MIIREPLLGMQLCTMAHHFCRAVPIVMVIVCVETYDTQQLTARITVCSGGQRCARYKTSYVRGIETFDRCPREDFIFCMNEDFVVLPCRTLYLNVAIVM